jgi:hypothetical protein
MSPDELWDEAIQSATWRVNEYKFDYGALTPTEEKIKRFIPFYTYPRKAIPTVMTSMVTNPGQMAAFSRLYANPKYEDSGGAGPNFGPGFLFPDFIRERGFRNLNGDVKNPWVLGSAGTPMETISSPKNLLQFLGPVPNIAYEAITGERLDPEYKGGVPDLTSVDGLFEYLTGQMRTARDVREVYRMSTGGKKPLAEGLIKLLTGTDVRQVTDAQKESAFRGVKADFERNDLGSVDKKLAKIGLHIYAGEGNNSGNIYVKDKMFPNREPKKFTTKQEAEDYIKARYSL